MKRATTSVLLLGLALAQSGAEAPTPAPALPTAPKSSLYVFAETGSASSLLLYEQAPSPETYVFEAPLPSSAAGWDFLFLREPGADSMSAASPTALREAQPAEEEGAPAPAVLATPPAALPKVLAPTTPGAYPFPFPQKPAQAAEPAMTDTPSNGKASDPRLRPGALVPARLVTAAVVPAGMSVPVLVEAKPEGCEGEPCPQLRYLGEARIMLGGRVEVSLKYAVVNGRSTPIEASGFAKDDVGYGLRGDVIEQAPSLAADLIRGTLGGISDWTTAALQAQDTTIAPSGAVAVNKTTPPLSSFLASRAASLFSLPQDSKALTRVMVVPAGTPLYVYVQGTPSGTPEARR